MEKYIDELVITKKQQILRVIAVILSMIVFPFVCLGLGTFYTINYFTSLNI